MSNFLDFSWESLGTWLRILFSLETVFIWQLYWLPFHFQAETLPDHEGSGQDLTSAENLLQEASATGKRDVGQTGK